MFVLLPSLHLVEMCLTVSVEGFCLLVTNYNFGYERDWPTVSYICLGFTPLGGFSPCLTSPSRPYQSHISYLQASHQTLSTTVEVLGINPQIPIIHHSSQQFPTSVACLSWQGYCGWILKGLCYYLKHIFLFRDTADLFHIYHHAACG